MAFSAGLKWSTSPSDLATNVRLHGQAVEIAVGEFSAALATAMESYAKQNAPWTDRTGQARATLVAAVERSGPAYRVTLAHGVFYGIYLELKHGGVWGIVLKTLALHAPYWAAYCRARGFR